MDLAVKECTGRKDHGRSGELRPVTQPKARNLLLIKQQLDCFTLHDLQTNLAREEPVNGELESRPVRLHTRAANRSALARVEHPVVNGRVIGSARDQPVEGIDLAHEMPFTQPSNRRVARHGADRIPAEAYQRGAGAQARRGGRSLATGMSASNDHNIKASRHGHALIDLGRFCTVPRGTQGSSLSDAECAEQPVEHILHPDPAGDAIERLSSQPSNSAATSGSPVRAARLKLWTHSASAVR
jgi:hypothetical protein